MLVDVVASALELLRVLVAAVGAHPPRPPVVRILSLVNLVFLDIDSTSPVGSRLIT